MSRTIRNYSSGIETHKDGIRTHKFLKLVDRYTGWVGEESWNRKAKATNKRLANKRNRRIMNKMPEYTNW